MKSVILTLILSLGAFSPAVAQKLDRSKVPQPGPAPVIQIGEYEGFKLDNGLQVFVVENRKLPRVSFSLNLDYSPVMEGDEVGYLNALGMILRRGAGDRNKDQMDEDVDFIAAGLSVSSSSIFGSSLSKYSETILGMMSDVAMRATFPAEELDKIKKEMTDNLVNSKDSPSWIAGNVRRTLLYGDKHPYGQVMTEETIAAIQMDTLKNHYKTYWRPNVGYLTVVGDISVKEAKPLIEKYFGAWEQGEVPVKTYEMPKPPAKTAVAVAQKDGAVQTEIRVAYPVKYTVGDDNFFQARVMNTMLGGGTFRLFDNIREDKGYTYGAYSQLSSDRLVGFFNAQAAVRNDVTSESVKEFLYEMDRIRDTVAEADEVQLIKNFMTGSFARSLESPNTIANFALNTAIYDLPKDYYQNYLKNINAVTAEEIQAAAKDFIKPKNTWIIAVGDAEQLSKDLAKYGEVSRFDIYGRPWTPPAATLPEGLTAQQVIDKAIEAQGGMDKLKTISNMVTKGDMNAMGMTMAITQIASTKPSSLVEIEMNGQVAIRSAFNGEAGSRSQMGQKAPMSPEEVANQKLGAHPFSEIVFGEIKPELSLDGVDEVDGKTLYLVAVTPPGGAKSVRGYDAETGLLMRTTSSNGPVTQTVTLGDYKAVDGVMVPHKMTISAGPQKFDIIVKEVNFNQELTAETFKLDE